MIFVVHFKIKHWIPSFYLESSSSNSTRENFSTRICHVNLKFKVEPFSRLNVYWVRLTDKNFSTGNQLNKLVRNSIIWGCRIVYIFSSEPSCFLSHSSKRRERCTREHQKKNTCINFSKNYICLNNIIQTSRTICVQGAAEIASSLQTI